MAQLGQDDPKTEVQNVRQQAIGGHAIAAALPKLTLGALLERIGDYWTLGVLILVIIVFGFTAPDFYTQANWLATSVYSTEIMLLALGQTFVIVTGGIDLSDGAVLGFSSMAGALVMEHMLHLRGISSVWIIVAGFAAGIAAGTIAGFVNGLLITKLRLAPFIVTLGMLGMAGGAIDLLHGGREIIDMPSQVSAIGNTVIGGWFPIPVLVTAFFCVVTWLLLSKTTFGRHVYAIGSNPTAARRAGINIDRHLIAVYVISGFLAAVSGLLVMARFNDASPIAGANDELGAIAAVVIGGASLFGGRGTIQGAIIGTLLISLLDTGLVLANVQPFWQQVAIGAIIILAVFLDQVRLRLKER